jgi:SRSO17 transposase
MACAVAIRVYWPGYGQVRLMVTKDGHGRYEYLVTNKLDADLTWVVMAKCLRWNIEVLFRGVKQLAGLGACQCYVYRAMVRHVALAMLSYVVLQLLRTDLSETVDSVKERKQLYTVTGGMAPPVPLRARTM